MHRGPSITFDVQALVDGTSKAKSRSLQLSHGGISCLKASGHQKKPEWSHAADDIFSVAKSKTDPKRFTVSVLQRFEFQAEDPQAVQRVLDAFKGLNLGKQHNSSTNQPTNTSADPEEATDDQKKSKDHEQQQSSSESAGMMMSSDVTTTNNKTPLSLADFDVKKVIGEGSFGRVMKVQKRDTRQIFAMKMLSIDDYPGDVYAEAAILAKLAHPFVVDFSFSFEQQRKLYLGMEYVSGGELFHALQAAPQRRLNEEQAKFYMAQVILALEYLHKRHIVYRDLKPENILLGSDGHIKLADFGLAKSGVGITAGSGASTFCGTPQYLAPEILLGKHQSSGADYGVAVDWWSAGILLFEMLTGSVPFYSPNRTQLYRNAIQSEIEFPAYVSKEAASFVRGVLVRRPEDRLGSGKHLGVLEIKQHAFFRGMRWDLLLHKKLKPPATSRAKKTANSVSSVGSSGNGPNKSVDSVGSDHLMSVVQRRHSSGTFSNLSSEGDDNDSHHIKFNSSSAKVNLKQHKFSLGDDSPVDSFHDSQSLDQFIDSVHGDESSSLLRSPLLAPKQPDLFFRSHRPNNANTRTLSYDDDDDVHEEHHHHLSSLGHSPRLHDDDATSSSLDSFIHSVESRNRQAPSSQHKTHGGTQHKTTPPIQSFVR